MKKSLIIIILIILLINSVSAFCPYDDAGNAASKSLNKKIAGNMDGAGKFIEEIKNPYTKFEGLNLDYYSTLTKEKRYANINRFYKKSGFVDLASNPVSIEGYSGIVGYFDMGPGVGSRLVSARSSNGIQEVYLIGKNGGLNRISGDVNQIESLLIKNLGPEFALTKTTDEFGNLIITIKRGKGGEVHSFVAVGNTILPYIR